MRLAARLVGRDSERADLNRLFEAVRCAFSSIASGGPAAIVLDDLHWADETTLELLAAVGEGLVESEPLLLLGVYRRDQLPRAHPVRRLPCELRRCHRLIEITLKPLSPEDTAALAADLIGGSPAPAPTGSRPLPGRRTFFRSPSVMPSSCAWTASPGKPAGRSRWPPSWVQPSTWISSSP